MHLVNACRAPVCGRKKKKASPYCTHTKTHTHPRSCSSKCVRQYEQVRALLWREKWLTGQIEILSQQKQEAQAGLDRALTEKRKTSLITTPSNDSPAGVGGHAGTADGQNAAATTDPTIANQAEISRNKNKDTARDGRCARTEDWGTALSGRRRVLVQSYEPVSCRGEFTPKQGRVCCLGMPVQSSCLLLACMCLYVCVHFVPSPAKKN
jgi:hypothetical protein